MAEAILVVKIDSEGNVQAIKQARQEIGATGEQSKKTSDSLGGLKKAAAFAAGAFAAIKSAQAAVDFVKMGAQVQAVEHRFVAFAGGAQQAQEYMEAFQRASDGTVDRMGAMSGASKMLQMGLVDNADEMEVMAAIAVRLGDTTMSATERVDAFSLLLANQSKERLDTFGISSAKVRARIQELTKAGYDLEQAFKLAVLEEGRKSLDILGDTSQLTATKIAKVEAAFSDLKTGLAVASVEMLDSAGILDRFAVGASMILETLERIGMFAQAYGAGVKAYVGSFSKTEALAVFQGQLRAGAAAMADLGAGEEELRYKHLAMAESFAEGATRASAYNAEVAAIAETYGSSTERWDQYSAALQSTYEGMDRAAIAAVEYREAQDKANEAAGTAALKFYSMAESLKGATEAQIASTAIRELSNLLEDGQITASDYAVAVQETQLAFGLADEASLNLSNRLNTLVENFGSGKVAATEFDDGLAHLIDVNTMENLQIEKFGGLLADQATPATHDHTVAVEAMSGSLDRAAGLTEAQRGKMRELEQQLLATKAQAYGFRDAINAIPATKDVTIRIREIKEVIRQESPGITVPEISRQHGGPAVGLTLIHGPELVQLPQGSYVYSPQQTRQMLSGAAQSGPMAAEIGMQKLNDMAKSLWLVIEAAEIGTHEFARMAGSLWLAIEAAEMGAQKFAGMVEPTEPVTPPIYVEPAPPSLPPTEPVTPWVYWVPPQPWLPPTEPVTPPIYGVPPRPFPSTEEVAAGSGGGGRGGNVYHITNVFGQNSVRSEADIEEIGNQLERNLNLRGARKYRI